MARDTRADRDASKDEGAWSKTDDGAHVTDFKKAPSPMGRRVGALVAWVVGIAVELAVVAIVSGSALPDAGLPKPAVVIVGIVVALACSLAGAALWKRAQAMRAQAKGAQPSGTSMTSVVMSTASFVPMALYFAVAKNASASTRVASLVALLAVVVVATALVVVP